MGSPNKVEIDSHCSYNLFWLALENMDGVTFSALFKGNIVPPNTIDKKHYSQHYSLEILFILALFTLFTFIYTHIIHIFTIIYTDTIHNIHIIHTNIIQYSN